MNTLTLYTYFRSSAAFRVRIALRLKNLPATHHAVSLIDNAHLQPDYGAIHPLKLVPALAVGGEVITQSLAILEYLDEAFPDTPPLVWGDALTRAKIRSLALLVACDIHPLNNLRVQRYLKSAAGLDEAAVKRWCQHWLRQGFDALEAALGAPGKHCVDEAVSLADVCLVPQVFSAQRAGLEMSPYPNIMSRFEALMSLDAFRLAEPAAQPDAR